MTNGFSKLATRIALMLDHVSVNEALNKLLVVEGLDQTDVRLAFAAARMIRDSDWPLGPNCGECKHLEIEHNEERDEDGCRCRVDGCNCGTRIGR